LDSKPIGKYDGEAINALIDILSYQRPKYNSGLVTVIDESGDEKNIFTYSVGCENVEVIDVNPNKALKFVPALQASTGQLSLGI